MHDGALCSHGRCSWACCCSLGACWRLSPPSYQRQQREWRHCWHGGLDVRGGTCRALKNTCQLQVMILHCCAPSIQYSTLCVVIGTIKPYLCFPLPHPCCFPLPCPCLPPTPYSLQCCHLTSLLIAAALDHFEKKVSTVSHMSFVNGLVGASAMPFLVTDEVAGGCFDVGILFQFSDSALIWQQCPCLATAL